MPEVNMRHARTEEQRRLYERIQGDRVCSFCVDFCQGKSPTYHPNPVIKETEHWAFTESFPKYEGAEKHFLIVSKFFDEERHVLFPNLPPEAWQDLGVLIEWAIEEYRLPAGGFFFRFGDTDFTGASISHFHAQLIFGGGKEGEALRVKLGYKAK
ncbi:MAG: hypothetical protein AAB507_01105 [Patescibacteria group bacterium]